MSSSEKHTLTLEYSTTLFVYTEMLERMPVSYLNHIWGRKGSSQIVILLHTKQIFFKKNLALSLTGVLWISKCKIKQTNQ